MRQLVEDVSGTVLGVTFSGITHHRTLRGATPNAAPPGLSGKRNKRRCAPPGARIFAAAGANAAGAAPIRSMAAR